MQEFLVIGIAGGSGSGKTTLTRDVMKQLDDNNVQYVYLCSDNYYRPINHLTMEERGKVNFDHPDSLEIDLLVQNIRDIKEGKVVYAPQYDFSTHSRKEETTELQIDSKLNTVVIIEGILIFTNKDLVDICDIKLFVDTAADVRCVRRIRRDITERGRTVDSVCDQYLTTVMPMHNKFVEDTKNLAHMIIPHGSNSIAVDCIVSKAILFAK